MENEKRLIWADEALAAEFTIEEKGAIGYVVDSEVIRRLPTVDAVEVVHGRWIARKICVDSTIFKCSECARDVEVTNDYFGKPSNHVAKYYPYCHCGAKMNGGNEDV